MPGGVTPPIGTLPPATGITPGMPGGVTPPIGTLPPATGITPGMPGGVTPPIGTLPPGNAVPAQPSATAPSRAPSEGAIVPSPNPGACRDPRDPSGAMGRDMNLPECQPTKPECPPDRCDYQLDVAQAGPAETEVPITPGRDFGVQTDWNAWTDVRQLSSHDGR